MSASYRENKSIVLILTSEPVGECKWLFSQLYTSCHSLSRVVVNQRASHRVPVSPITSPTWAHAGHRVIEDQLDVCLLQWKQSIVFNNPEDRWHMRSFLAGIFKVCSTDRLSKSVRKWILAFARFVIGLYRWIITVYHNKSFGTSCQK